MPNPELSQYKDHDTNTVYDLKDAAGRATLATVQADIRKSIISISTMANGQDADYTDWLFMSALNNGYFVGQDQAFVRIHFNSSLVSYSKPVRFIYYFDETHGQGVYICNVVTNYFTMENLGGHYKQGDVLDFIFFKLTNTFVLVGPSDSVDLSNYYTKTQTDTLLNAKVSDNPTFTEAATRQNIASGETFAVILGKIKKFFTDLKTVAFTGSYNDLTDKPSIPSGQVQSDWSQSDTTAVDFIKNKPTIPSALSDLSDDSTHRVVTDTEKSTWSGKVSDNPTFTEASTRANIASGESFATILGKIKKFFTDLKTVAFTGSYNDLSNTPTIPTSNDYIQKTNGHANGSIDIDSMSGSVSQIAVHGNGSQDANIVANQASIGYIGMRIDGNGYKEIYAMNSNFQDDILLSIDDNRVIGGILGDKQDALTAGTNISISGNTISATDTKPRDGQFDNTPTPVSVPNSTDWSCIAPDDPICTAPAGSVWIVSVALQYPSNTSGFRSIAISTTNTGSTAPAAIMQQTVAPANGAATNLIFTTFVAPTTATTYYVWGRQNSGAARNVTYRYRAIRIL